MLEQGATKGVDAAIDQPRSRRIAGRAEGGHARAVQGHDAVPAQRLDRAQGQRPYRPRRRERSFQVQKIGLQKRIAIEQEKARLQTVSGVMERARRARPVVKSPFVLQSAGGSLRLGYY